MNIDPNDTAAAHGRLRISPPPPRRENIGGCRWLILALATGCTIPIGCTIPSPAQRPLVIAKLGNFFAGGVRNPDDQIAGQMYVEYIIPKRQRSPYPIVLVHGGGQIGAGWTQTPDGREGWAQYFVRRGFAVYVVDQPARGRSAYTSHLGPLRDPANSSRVRQLFAAAERFNLWPAAHLHTQWVGAGVDGDPTFEQFLASQAAAITTTALQEKLTADGLVALLDRIGPSILIAHSQPGSAAWLVVDARPNLVKALVQLEPGGPPVARDEPSPAFPVGPTFAWGLTRNPITYSPSVSDSSQLRFVALSKEPGIATCWVQSDPARQLPNLQKVPTLLVSSPSGYNTAWDPCMVAYLKQAGVDANLTWLKLQDIGIEGNGHFMFIERNSDQVAGVILDWILDHVQGISCRAITIKRDINYAHKTRTESKHVEVEHCSGRHARLHRIRAGLWPDT